MNQGFYEEALDIAVVQLTWNYDDKDAHQIVFDCLHGVGYNSKVCEITKQRLKDIVVLE